MGQPFYFLIENVIFFTKKTIIAILKFITKNENHVLLNFRLTLVIATTLATIVKSLQHAKNGEILTLLQCSLLWQKFNFLVGHEVQWRAKLVLHVMLKK